ncbi:hypothetical protein [Streptoalloteichus hindustanus]|uniref:hypothetical protein n=1 Tax=Streptoalloteichus hindustanus TaxID=2017 RepID=UPI00135657E0|nr:hypothetical protein [Streptoalloteichus hindustanus]
MLVLAVRASFPGAAVVLTGPGVVAYNMASRQAVVVRKVDWDLHMANPPAEIGD